jgi:hypothetical protein
MLSRRAMFFGMAAASVMPIGHANAGIEVGYLSMLLPFDSAAILPVHGSKGFGDFLDDSTKAIQRNHGWDTEVWFGQVVRLSDGSERLQAWAVFDRSKWAEEMKLQLEA